MATMENDELAEYLDVLKRANCRYQPAFVGDGHGGYGEGAGKAADGN